MVDFSQCDQQELLEHVSQRDGDVRVQPIYVSVHSHEHAKDYTVDGSGGAVGLSVRVLGCAQGERRTAPSVRFVLSGEGREVSMSKSARDAPGRLGRSMSRMAVTGDWSRKVEGGCDRLWTDFGTPMCSAGGSVCFVINPKAQSCPLGKCVREGSDHE